MADRRWALVMLLLGALGCSGQSQPSPGEPKPLVGDRIPKGAGPTPPAKQP